MEGLLDPRTVGEILALIERYGYFFVLIGAMLQSVGLPLPAQTVLITAGVMAGQGILDPFLAAAVGISGAVLGSQLGYFIGRKGGRPFVLRWGRHLGATEERLDRAEGFFRKHERRAVFAARFVPVLKTFGYLAAGVIKMPHAIFFRYDLLGTTVWAAASILAGYFVSEAVMSLIE
ncbi:MAG: DedA family protein [Rubrobacter sp.]|jgi:undecaprenyl-diphosphatase|nr:DedA family protein [Rubrobacter sp.]